MSPHPQTRPGIHCSHRSASAPLDAHGHQAPEQAAAQPARCAAARQAMSVRHEECVEADAAPPASRSAPAGSSDVDALRALPVPLREVPEQNGMAGARAPVQSCTICLQQMWPSLARIEPTSCVCIGGRRRKKMAPGLKRVPCVCPGAGARNEILLMRLGSTGRGLPCSWAGAYIQRADEARLMPEALTDGWWIPSIEQSF